MRNIVTVTDIRRRAAGVLHDVNQSHEPIVVTQRGSAIAVLLSPQLYTKIENVLEQFEETDYRIAKDSGDLE